jgi:hypothetical protein
VAQLTSASGKALLSGRALLVLALWAGVTGWAAWGMHRAGLAWDGSGHGISDAIALMAETRPDAEVTLIGTSAVERLLVPLARQTGRLQVRRVDPLALAARPPEGPVVPVPGDVQVRSGNSWLLLHDPDFAAVLAALAATSAPDALEGLGPPPLAGVEARHVGERPPAAPVGGRTRAMVWAMTGLLLPASVAVGGVVWYARRRGR